MKPLTGPTAGGLAAAVLAGALSATPALAAPAREPVRQAALPVAASVPPGIKGLDVSSHQPNVSWPQVWKDGARFAFIKATESVTYRNPYYSQQYTGARNVGMIRGAYHFALPHKSSGAAQADYFVKNGGHWTADGWTLPGVLDIEFNPYQSSNGLDTCYGFSDAKMVAWVKEFSDRYAVLTGRKPIIYTNGYWWKTCTGDSTAFSGNSLWIAQYSSTLGPLPPGWKQQAIWQYDSSGIFPGDQNVFNGNYASLQTLARGKAATRIRTMNVSPEPVRKGRVLVVKGTLHRDDTGAPVPGARVTLVFQKKGATARSSVKTVTTDASGTFRTTVTARLDGTWQVAFGGDGGRVASTSRTDYVNVR
ncbi:GH25 family lysozyme [Spirillospora albida]|uniref:GH25 family lysozyme n=1 Tax=Spirillospora albida TaxID=58123 RepID=UPI0009FEB3B3|nr:GH25 family lysozyme [Spirillospora albida]